MFFKDAISMGDKENQSIDASPSCFIVMYHKVKKESIHGW